MTKSNDWPGRASAIEQAARGSTHRPGWRLPALTALTVIFGLQHLRAQLAYYQYLFGDRFGWQPLAIGGLALALFLFPLAFGSLARATAPARLVRATAVVTAVSALLAQLWTGEPLVDFAFTTLGVWAFLLFPPALVAAQMGPEVHRAFVGRRTGLWMLTGLAASTGLQGLFLTYDPIWQRTLGALAAQLTLAAAMFLCLRGAHQLELNAAGHRDLPWQLALSWTGQGPFWAFILLVGGNLARFNAESGWEIPWTLAWLLAGLGAAILLARWLPPGRATALIAGLLLMATAVPPLDGTLALLLSRFLGLTAAGLLLVSGLTQTAIQRRSWGVARTTLALSAGWFLFVLLIFAYYVTYELAIPVDRSSVLYAAALLAAAPIILASDRWFFAWKQSPAGLWMGVTAMAMALLWLATWAIWSLPPRLQGGHSELRVFNYNLHNGFHPWGGLDMERQARTILDQSPDLVALQEVSRGWVINGSVDMMTWLSWRLRLNGAFAPAADKDWGHAVLSRLPLLRQEVYALPPAGLPLARSFAFHRFDVGADKPLQLINTHLHHTFTDNAVREQQVDALLDFLGTEPLDKFLITGDFNAEPDDPVVRKIRDRGFEDLVAKAGLSPGYTFPSLAPTRRIDYIFATPDFVLTRAEIPASQTSDHLGISVELAPP